MNQNPSGVGRQARRRHLVIDRKWQIAVAFRLAFSAVVVAAIVQVATVQFLAIGESGESNDSGSDSWGTAALLLSLLQPTVLFGALWCFAIRLTHSVAGPARVLVTAVDDMCQGRFDSRLTLREGDYLQDLAAALQRLQRHLQKQEQRVHDATPARPLPAEAATPQLVGAGQATGSSSASGFSLVEAMCATTLLVAGVMSTVSLSMSCTNLQSRISQESIAHCAARDLLEQIRSAGPTAALAQYTATPTVTVQGLQATVSFPEVVGTGNFAGMTNTTALSRGFLPVRITINQNGRRYVLTTFVGVQ